MADTRDNKPRTHRMDAYITEESYEALQTGDAVFNNGLRSKDGYFWPDQPDYEEPDENETAEEESEAEYVASDGAALLIIGGIAVAFIAGVKAAPYIGSFWHDKAVPTIAKIKKKLTGKSADDQEEIPSNNEYMESANAFLAEISPAKFSEEVDTVLSEYESDMSSEEAQEHLIKIIMLAAYLAEEIRKLSGASIKTDSKGYLELQRAMEKLTTQKVTDGINMILANNISMLNVRASKTLSEILGGNFTQNGVFMPIKNSRVKEVLSLGHASDNVKEQQ